MLGRVKIPNGDKAIVDLAKLRDYCLNPLHPRGRHKARVFEACLGLTAQDAETLRRALLDAAAYGEDATLGDTDEFGQRYVLDSAMDGPRGSGIIRSSSSAPSPFQGEGWGEGRIEQHQYINPLTQPLPQRGRGVLRRPAMSSKRDKSRSERTIKVLDVVAVLVDLPERGLVRGQVGTVVETLGGETYEVEFSDDEGRTYAQLALQRDQLMLLHHHPMEAA